MKMRTVKYIIPFLIITAMACKNESTPRPYAYPRIDIPSQEYVNPHLDSIYPYNFELNTEANWETENGGYAWINVVYPSIRSKVQLTYKPVEDNLNILLEEAHHLAYNHTVRADGIRESQYINPKNGTYGLLYRLKGDAATSTQFFVTDSTDHFIRGVVYFYSSPNADSLAPVNAFMAEEVMHMMETIQWNNK